MNFKAETRGPACPYRIKGYLITVLASLTTSWPWLRVPRPRGRLPTPPCHPRNPSPSGEEARASRRARRSRAEEIARSPRRALPRPALLAPRRRASRAPSSVPSLRACQCKRRHRRDTKFYFSSASSGPDPPPSHPHSSVRKHPGPSAASPFASFVTP